MAISCCALLNGRILRDERKSFSPRWSAAGWRRCDYTSYPQPRLHPAERSNFRSRRIRDDLRQRGLPRPQRSNKIMDEIRSASMARRSNSPADDVPFTCRCIHPACGAHQGRERRRGRGIAGFRGRRFKKVCHANKIADHASDAPIKKRIVLQIFPEVVSCCRKRPHSMKDNVHTLLVPIDFSDVTAKVLESAQGFLSI